LAALAALAVGGGAPQTPVTFNLLTWDDSQAAVELPSAVGLKPSPVYPTEGDWLLFTDDDEQLAASNNPAGAVSHNLVDITGVGGAGFNRAPSLSGSAALTMEFSCMEPGLWSVAVTDLGYSGQANPAMQMNQFLVSPGSPATQDPAFNVDGLGNSGEWSAEAVNDWAIGYTLDFYFATNVDGDPDPDDIDATFDDKMQRGYLIPVNALTLEGMAAVDLDDPAGFFDGDFELYLLDEIAPRLPDDASYLVITQMDKINPDYAEIGLPLTTGSLIGNTTIAYTTQVIPIEGEDADGDGDVDLDDFSLFADCVAGPGTAPDPPPPVSAGQCLCVFDVDRDGDVDLIDFAGFQDAFTN
jgi:hypothetical protein